MIRDALDAMTAARALADSERFAGPAEYHRAHLVVLLAILDRLDVPSAGAVHAESTPAPTTEPAKRQRR